MVEVSEGDRNDRHDPRRHPRGAQSPLPQTCRARVTLRAVDDISYLSIDSELLDVMITWDQTGSYEVAELQAQLQSERLPTTG